MTTNPTDLITIQALREQIEANARFSFPYYFGPPAALIPDVEFVITTRPSTNHDDCGGALCEKWSAGVFYGTSGSWHLYLSSAEEEESVVEALRGLLRVSEEAVGRMRWPSQGGEGGEEGQALWEMCES